MIQLTNEFDNPIYVAASHIELMEVCNLKQNDQRSQLAVLLHLTSGKTYKVQECISEINKKIKDYWNE